MMPAEACSLLHRLVHPSTLIQIGQSSVHGQGAFAAADISEGHRIGVYEGRRYSARQVARRNWDTGLTYVFGLSDGSVVDAKDGGNATRHLNHSCSPNCVAYEEASPAGQLLIVFYALRDVRRGEELFLDYSLAVDDSEDLRRFACCCRAEVCRGSMLAAP